MLIKMADINITGGTQPRAEIDFDTVGEYAEAMEEGAKFPPVVVFDDGAVKWLAEGFHRFHATQGVGYVDIEADVRQGTRRDAVLHAVGSNVKHGLRRTNEDKRKAVAMLLADPEWVEWSDSEIARKCAVGHTLVSTMRNSIFTGSKDSPPRKVTRNGVTYEQDTAKIGRKKGETENKPVVCEPNMPITDGDERAPGTSEPRQVTMYEPVVETPAKGGSLTVAYVYARAAIAQLSKIQRWDKEGVMELKRVGAFIENKIGELSGGTGVQARG